MKFSSKTMIFSIITISLLGTMVSPAHARPRKQRTGKKHKRHKRDNRALLGGLAGAGTFGAIAGLAGSAKWVPLGVVGGGIAGYLLFRSLRNNNGRNSHVEKSNTKKRRHVQDTEPQPVQKQEG